MAQIRSVHRVDHEGNPLGGTTLGYGFRISWDAPGLEQGLPRAIPEDVIAAVVDRLEFEQRQRPERQRALAITKLQEAQHWLMFHHLERDVSTETRAVEQPASAV